jgi:hypothetical protein
MKKVHVNFGKEKNCQDVRGEIRLSKASRVDIVRSNENQKCKMHNAWEKKTQRGLGKPADAAGPSDRAM